jgi:hypothetical protein
MSLEKAVDVDAAPEYAGFPEVNIPVLEVGDFYIVAPDRDATNAPDGRLVVEMTVGQDKGIDPFTKAGVHPRVAHACIDQDPQVSALQVKAGTEREQRSVFSGDQKDTRSDLFHSAAPYHNLNLSFNVVERIFKKAG